MTLDQQERFGPIDFDWFHQEHLPVLLEKQGEVFSESDAAVVRPLAFQLSDGRAYTYLPDGKTFSVQPGASAAHTIVELTPDAWSGFAWELKTCFALLYADQLSVTRGTFSQVARWEPPLRVAFSDQVLFDLDTPARIDDEDGRDIDLARSFTLGDPPEEIRDFLHLPASCICAASSTPAKSVPSGPMSRSLSMKRGPMTGSPGGRPSTVVRSATG